MFFFRHNLKVRNVVVSCVAINVVNNLIFEQITTYGLLHNEPVNEHVSFAVSVRMFRDSICKVFPFSSVSNFSLGSRLLVLPRRAALNGTILLRSIPCASGWFSAMQTHRSYLVPPARFKVAICGAELRCLFTPILGAELTPAIDARNDNCFFLHGYKVYSANEEYCKIAVQRLSQEVMNFDEPEDKPTQEVLL